MSRSATAERPAPDWLIDGPFEERTLGVLKSGKEAEVFLVERRTASRACLLAHKRFRPRHPKKDELRDLGFTHGAIYRHDSVYRAGWHLNARDRRAVETGTHYGQEVRERLWPANEFDVLGRAWAAGVMRSPGGHARIGQRDPDGVHRRRDVRRAAAGPGPAGCRRASARPRPAPRLARSAVVGRENNNINTPICWSVTCSGGRDGWS